MNTSKLWNHEKEAIEEALACAMTIKAQSGDVKDSTINTLRAMLGLKDKIDDSMNKAIAEGEKNRRKALKEEKEQDELNIKYQWEAFKPYCIERVKECLSTKGDLVDLINTLDLEYDPCDSLENDQINEIVYEAALKVALDNKEIMRIERKG